MTNIKIPILTHGNRKAARGRPADALAVKKKGGRPTSEVLRAMNDLRALVAVGHGRALVEKALEIAANDRHPHQGLMLRTLIEKILPIDAFKSVLEAPQSTIDVTITEADGRKTEIHVGGGEVEEPETIDQEIEDIEYSESVTVSEVADEQP